ncbi:hypothetical protein GCM10011342_28270 [Aquisalinus flavus]|uniref:Uncharacterized protein n=1 Tax=Aquisalinus flavus TaxID=1526572 RepID=A0A8J2Y8A8_9PROT|nr:hypothetical protein GCM10011342_28270 [Aquisalinus flavus]
MVSQAGSIAAPIAAASPSCSAIPADAPNGVARAKAPAAMPVAIPGKRLTRLDICGLRFIHPGVDVAIVNKWLIFSKAIEDCFAESAK